MSQISVLVYQLYLQLALPGKETLSRALRVIKTESENKIVHFCNGHQTWRVKQTITQEEKLSFLQVS